MSSSQDDSVIWDVDGQKRGSVGLPLGDVLQPLSSADYRLPLPILLELPPGLALDDLGALSTKTPRDVAATIAQNRMALVKQHPDWASLRVHFMTPDRTVIGSNPTACDVILGGKGITKRHATVLGAGTEWHVIIHGSKSDGSLEGVTLESMDPTPIVGGHLLGFASYGLLFLFPEQIQSLATSLGSQAPSPADSALGHGSLSPGFAPSPRGVAFSDVLFAAGEPGFLEQWKAPCLLQVPLEEKSRGDTPDTPFNPAHTQRISKNTLEGMKTTKKVGDSRLHPLAFAEGQTKLVIGRSEGCDVLLEEGTVSKRHAKISLGAGGEWFLIDTGSSNGTFVKGALLPPDMPYLLKGGEKLWFASYWALFLLPQQFQRMVQHSLG